MDLAMDLGSLLWALIAGTVVGLLATWITRGERLPLWITVLCGIAGVLIGNFLYTRLWLANTPSFDWWRHAWQVGVAALLVTVVGAAVRRHDH